MKLAFYKPKKDQCDLCTGFKNKTVDHETYSQHIRRKTEAAQEKQNDKDKASTEGKVKVVTMDLQSLLLCPNYYNSIRPGHDIRVLKYTLNYSDGDFGEICKSRNASPSFDERAPPLRVRPLPLEQARYRHLQQIKAQWVIARLKWPTTDSCQPRSPTGDIKPIESPGGHEANFCHPGLTSSRF
ncbi:hypothetical protein DPMN_101569 [Dreissena polymorpha]|uniref:Uncharacterized protein n=1 Tax=Dreissena polymorpha TaxID=45954 RepID=A0A9D4LJL0_DREPO|nr:hypothetical protein DPMN_101569 [Dreissena polymorpha]